ncbi:MAG: Rieske 2Fe-2S domain-containing protein [Candidatus Aenigmarchaeota archaeon]|nr:Rieske 2Fe-2S domain-containing protein [Candidatus Aenigmarchaeota archaeon]
MTFIKVATIHDLKDGEAKVVDANGTPIALYRVNGKFYATTNTCAHRGGPLGEGVLDNEVITCPWHGWRFNVASGINVIMPSIKIQTYKVEVRSDDVFVDV